MQPADPSCVAELHSEADSIKFPQRCNLIPINVLPLIMSSLAALGLLGSATTSSALLFGTLGMSQTLRLLRGHAPTPLSPGDKLKLWAWTMRRIKVAPTRPR
jgi:hypothetical protein